MGLKDYYSEMGQSLGKASEKLSHSGRDDGNGNDTNFECNICFDLAQDPVVTLCGHLFCWPCLFKWLRIHSLSQECPVCQALVKEENLVPLYGRGKTSAVDPSSKSIPGIDIPNRPAAQRPETARPAPNMNQFPRFGSGFMGVDTPMVSATVTSISLSATFAPSSVDYQGNEFFVGGHGFFPPHPTSQWMPDTALKNLLLLVGVLGILWLSLPW